MTEKNQQILKCNFMDYYSEIDFGYERVSYLQSLTHFSENNLVKVLVGQRRAGKSFILRQFMRHLIQNDITSNSIFYLNKEDLLFDNITNYKDLDDLFQYYCSYYNLKGKVYIFLDEIQNIDAWEKFVNSYSQDNSNKYEVFITGSNSKMLSGELSSLLSGRYVSIEILPYSYYEYISISNLDRNKDSYIKFLSEGALPELHKLQEADTKKYYVSAVKDTILLRDIVQRYKIKDIALLDDLFKYLVNNSSKLISIANIVNYYKNLKKITSYETISNYISYFEEVFLVHKCLRYNISGKDVIGGNCKYYLNDMAFRNYLYPGIKFGIGYTLENLVYLELRRKGYDIYVGIINGLEVDFVATKGEKKLYLQVSYLLADEHTVERENSSLEKIPDNFEKYVVSLDDVVLASYNGIKHIQVWNLLDIL
jgi:predicted AAA+ superfamily ATPase